MCANARGGGVHAEVEWRSSFRVIVKPATEKQTTTNIDNTLGEDVVGATEVHLPQRTSKALFSLPQKAKNFQDSPSRRILWQMHEALNIDESKN